MLKDLKKISNLLNAKEKRKLYTVVLVKMLSGFMDMVGVASILPFIAVVSNQKILDENEIILKLKNFFNFENSEMILFLAIASLFIIILNQIVRILGGWFETYTTHDIWWSLNRQMFSYYINESYTYHIGTNSNQLLEKLTVQTNAAVQGAIIPIFQILGYLFTCVFLFFLLIAADPKVTVVLVILVGLFYSAFYSKLKKRVMTYGKFGPEYSRKVFKLVDQAFRSIKDIKMKDNAKFYVNLYDPLARRYAMNQVKINLVSNFPRFFLEIFTYTFAFSIVIYFVKGSRDFYEITILIGIYAFALQKILPAIQGIYQQFTSLKFYKPSLDRIFSDLILATNKFKNNKSNNYTQQDFLFTQKIEFKNIKYKYPNSKQEVLDIEYLKIKAGNIIGITGKTGSGKTTFIDLMLGLLNPTSGKILINEKNLNESFGNNWRSKIGYVPQFSFIADDTIIHNVALGQTGTEINTEKIKEVCKIAKVDNFIENELPLKYDTVVGENGVRLSGGQRQRLSIARALYKDPDIIVLDEATNSLDALTEKNIIEYLLKNYKNTTIIMIAHRLSVLKRCNEILLFDKGKIVDAGTYDFLFENNQVFKLMAEKN